MSKIAKFLIALVALFWATFGICSASPLGSQLASNDLSAVHVAIFGGVLFAFVCCVLVFIALTIHGNDPNPKSRSIRASYLLIGGTILLVAIINIIAYQIRIEL